MVFFYFFGGKFYFIWVEFKELGGNGKIWLIWNYGRENIWKKDLKVVLYFVGKVDVVVVVVGIVEGEF